ncbi:MAG: prolipoprotein diacylglyceryl transferase [Cytophagaceae bacterium]|nr:prolipoprotein diacylglyceryl transferase [Cytophagaceae bacterium]
MTIFNFILWDASPEIVQLGPVSIRWYSILFILGFLIGQRILIRIYRIEGKNEKDVDTITIYMLLATIIGARLGHCLFYDPIGYLKNPIDILKVWEGGLASHGGAAGILIATFLYSRKATNQSYLYVIDRIVITVALAGCLIRLGNLMNSEIIGKPTNTPTAFLFVHDTHKIIESIDEDMIKDVKMKENGSKIPSGDNTVDLAGIDVDIVFRKGKIDKDSIAQFLTYTIPSVGAHTSEHVIFPYPIVPEIKETGNEYHAVIKAFAYPRHPSQLYESLSSLALFFLLLYVYSRKKGNTPEGRLFGLFLVILFSLRFIYEYQKENQVGFEADMIERFGVNMGQLLSIPFVLVGIFILLRSFKKKNEII